MNKRYLLIAACVTVLSNCTGARLASKPGVYAVSVQSVHTTRREIHATYVRPVKTTHPGYLLVFATGDDGWFGTSGAIFEHLADQGYTIAGLSTTQAAQGLKELFAQAKRDLDLPDSTPIVIVGFSRGATVVAFAAVHPELRGGIGGAVAIALTREADYLHVPAGERGPEIQVDDKGRLQLYPALELLGSTRFAVIQSSNDSYVPAAESRKLLGPDTHTQRLYEVVSEDHGFSDARDKLMQDLDDALRWVEEATHASS
jgi:fermentation-respiration switch protein FrsA (DUF1100 family)